MSKIKSIFNNINNKKSKLNIFLYETDERYVSSIVKTEHNFYMPVQENCIDGTFQSKGRLATLHFDLVITGNQFDKSFQQIKELSSQFNAPLVIISHKKPWGFSDQFSCIEDIPKRFMGMLKQNTGDLSIADSDDIEQAWSSITSNLLTIPFGEDYDETKFIEVWNNVFNQFKEIL